MQVSKGGRKHPLMSSNLIDVGCGIFFSYFLPQQSQTESRLTHCPRVQQKTETNRKQLKFFVFPLAGTQIAFFRNYKCRKLIDFAAIAIA
jgi:hypothetical protein